MIAGNVVDRFQPFSTIKQVGWHHCIIKSSAVFVHTHGFSIFMVSGQGKSP